MHPFASPPPLHPGSIDEPASQPFLEIEGVDGSTLRATLSGLIVCPPHSRWSEEGHRHWAFDQIAGLRLDAYGPIGVVRATIRGTGTELPLLLLEPEQITAARRALEMIWNLMSSRSDSRPAA